MPPRLQSLSLPRPQGWFSRTAQPLISPLSFLLPQLQQQSRNAHILASLSDNPGAFSKKTRRGRGPASGKGKTSGRGHKGQKQHGKVPTGFNGGQTPEIVVHGERGFTNMFVFPLFILWFLDSLLLIMSTASPPNWPPQTSTASKNGSTKAASTQPAPSPSANSLNPAASINPKKA